MLSDFAVAKVRKVVTDTDFPRALLAAYRAYRGVGAADIFNPLMACACHHPSISVDKGRYMTNPFEIKTVRSEPVSVEPAQLFNQIQASFNDSERADNMNRLQSLAHGSGETQATATQMLANLAVSLPAAEGGARALNALATLAANGNRQAILRVHELFDPTIPLDSVSRFEGCYAKEQFLRKFTDAVTQQPSRLQGILVYLTEVKLTPPNLITGLVEQAHLFRPQERCELLGAIARLSVPDNCLQASVDAVDQLAKLAYRTTGPWKVAVEQLMTTQGQTWIDSRVQHQALVAAADELHRAEVSSLVRSSVLSVQLVDRLVEHAKNGRSTEPLVQILLRNDEEFHGTRLYAADRLLALCSGNPPVYLSPEAVMKLAAHEELPMQHREQLVMSLRNLDPNDAASCALAIVRDKRLHSNGRHTFCTEVKSAAISVLSTLIEDARDLDRPLFKDIVKELRFHRQTESILGEPAAMALSARGLADIPSAAIDFIKRWRNMLF
jgi:hypothetical protein